MPITTGSVTQLAHAASRRTAASVLASTLRRCIASAHRSDRYLRHRSDFHPGPPERSPDTAHSTLSSSSTLENREAIDVHRTKAQATESERRSTGSDVHVEPSAKRKRLSEEAGAIMFVGVELAATSYAATVAPISGPESVPFPNARAFKKGGRAKLPLYSYHARFPHARVVYVRDHEAANRELERMFSHTLAKPRIVGFDLEWRPTFASGSPEHPIALVQIATEQNVLLLQVSAMKMFPIKLVHFLDDENIIKAGVNILGDCQRLYRDFAVSTRSCVELSYLARCVDRSRWPGIFKELISLARLVHAYENCSLPKGKTQLSNWEEVLTERQQEYAANDAHAGLVVCAGLMNRAQNIDRSLFMFNVIQAIPLHPDGARWRLIDPLPAPTPTELASSTSLEMVAEGRSGEVQAKVSSSWLSFLTSSVASQ